jgi:hypothetical protein
MPTPPPQLPPLTTAESSKGVHTSTFEDVLTFLDRLKTLPHADKLHATTFGQTQEGRSMPLVIVADPPLTTNAEVLASGKLRILINANIHAGEVEGKEAVLMILREIALGEHAELLEHAVLLFTPIYNADGNERFDLRNRATQNGPDGGVGIRPNAQGLDLNRDFIKVEAPETKALLGLMRNFDPHLFMDLHTTNGSYHGYHLTYSPSLSTNVDPDLDAFNRGTLLPEVRRRMLARHELRVFDYGNFTDGAAREWVTYDHRPRFGTNYVGLRNRLSVLSEAYSNLDFPTRIHVTHAFVLEVLQSAVEHRREILAVTEEADARAMSGGLSHGFDSSLGEAIVEQVLVGAVEEVVLPDDLGIRHVALPDAQPTPMPVRRGFVSRSHQPYPDTWILPDPTKEMHALLLAHGILFQVTEQEQHMQVQVFATTSALREEAEFQGHHELALTGSWATGTRLVPSGSIVIPARQPLARVAAQLLEPQSEDSASTWDRLEGWLDGSGDSAVDSPVWRVGRP